MDDFHQLLSERERVRNVSVIAHVDHGKTTLTDSLLARAGLIKEGQAGDKRATDTRPDERDRGITIKSTAVSLSFMLSDAESEECDLSNRLLVHLIDSPGHVDFSSEVTAALRLSDGALVVVDAISGVCVQTETVLRQALAERVRPVLVINKVDRSILEKQLDPEELYLGLSQIINNVNAIIQTYSDPEQPQYLIDPGKGNVAFTSGVQGWGFTLPQIAEVYSAKLKVDKDKLVKRFWGNNYYDEQERRWSKTPEGSTNKRGFCKFVLDPIYKMLVACAEDRRPDALDLASKLDIQLTEQEVDTASRREFTRAIMRRWLPAADAMLDLMLYHLPSPLEAQKYRIKSLYEGPLDDEAAVAMQSCDAEGPLMMYISKMVPSSEKGRFLAFGRVFSGTLSVGQKVSVLRPNYTPAVKDKAEKSEATIPRLLSLVAGVTKAVECVPCGNVCAIVGIDKYLMKTGTITTYQQAHNLKVMKFSVSPVVQVAVEPVKPAELPKLVEGLRRLAKCEPMLQVISEGGQHIVAGAGQLHLEVCLKDLEDMHANIAIKKSQPVVTYKETVSELSDRVCLAKSTNKHNRIFLTAEPLDQGLIDDMEKGIVHPSQDVKERARYLADTYGWDINEARKVWCFGPHGQGLNILVDCTRGIQNLADAKDTIMAGFQWATQEGVLCEEVVHGVRYNITDVVIHPDPACRKGGQIIPTMRRAVMAAMLTAQPRLLEPVFMVQIQVPENHMGSVYTVLHKRRGEIVQETRPTAAPLFDLKAYLPVAESFGFSEELRASSSGQAFPQCVFDHWQPVPGGPLEAGSRAAHQIIQIRSRKGLQEDVPSLDTYLDKL